MQIGKINGLNFGKLHIIRDAGTAKFLDQYKTDKEKEESSRALYSIDKNSGKVDVYLRASYPEPHYRGSRDDYSLETTLYLTDCSNKELYSSNKLTIYDTEEGIKKSLNDAISQEKIQAVKDIANSVRKQNYSDGNSYTSMLLDEYM